MVIPRFRLRAALLASPLAGARRSQWDRMAILSDGVSESQLGNRALIVRTAQTFACVCLIQ
jgi:hypothetical protein